MSTMFSLCYIARVAPTLQNLSQEYEDETNKKTDVNQIKNQYVHIAEEA